MGDRVMTKWINILLSICALFVFELKAPCRSFGQNDDMDKLTPAQQNDLYQQLLNKSSEMARPYQEPPPDAYDYCRNGEVEALRKYLDNGGDPNWDKRTAGLPAPLLLWAILAFHNECVELLIERGADVNAPAFNVRNIATAAGLKLIDLKMTQFYGKGNRHGIEQLSQAIDLLIAHGAVLDNPFLAEKLNEAGIRAWNLAKSRGDAIVVAECRPDSIILPGLQISWSSLAESEHLATWCEQQAGKSNMVIAATIHPGGERSGERLLDLCMTYGVRMFTHQVILGSE